MQGFFNLLLGGLFILMGIIGIFVLQMEWSGLLFALSGLLLAGLGVHWLVEKAQE